MVGYRVKQLDTIEPSYRCPSCSLVLRDPIQFIDCGHRLCQSCANDQQGDSITCPECHQTAPRESIKLDRGFRNDMYPLSILCILCTWVGSLKSYQTHLDQTHAHPICEYCSEQYTSVNELYQHQFSNCEKIPVECILNQCGCTGKILRGDLNKHYLTDQHQLNLIKVVHQLTGKSSTSMGDRRPSTFDMTNCLEEVNKTTDILLAGVETLREDGQRLRDESDHHQNTLQIIAQDLVKVKKSIEEQNTITDEMVAKQKTLQKDILSMQETINSMKLSPYDGTLIWKITNVKDHMEAAKSGRQTSIYSQPFYSSPTGYKMCLRLYLNGDGSARETHMSLFFVLMRSDYDAILKFPFCFKVIFALFDQTDKQEHIIDTFRPDVRSNSFRRSQTNMNIASGIPKFVPLNVFEQENNPYIRDDTMFIKAMVDFSDIPKMILPSVLKISSALTTNIQQTMIRQQIEKLQQEQASNPSKIYIETI